MPSSLPLPPQHHQTQEIDQDSAAAAAVYEKKEVTRIFFKRGNTLSFHSTWTHCLPMELAQILQLPLRRSQVIRVFHSHRRKTTFLHGQSHLHHMTQELDQDAAFADAAGTVRSHREMWFTCCKRQNFLDTEFAIPCSQEERKRCTVHLRCTKIR